MNLTYVALFVDNSKDCYHRIYNEHNFLNTGIVTDLQGKVLQLFYRFKGCENGNESRNE